MQGKEDQELVLINDFPLEIIYEIAKNLPTSDFLNFFEAVLYPYVLKPLMARRQIVNLFLQHVVRGEHDEVRDMLTNDIHLIYEKGRITDCSNRTFEHISAFEYICWALDGPMLLVVLGCIPHNQEGNKVFTQLRLQYNQANTNGITYSLNGEIIIEHHYDFKIIAELQTQVNSIKVASCNDDWKAINIQWREGVGGAQKLFPMHVVTEYCSDVPFFPLQPFTNEPKSSKQFYNYVTRQDEYWFAPDSKLGVYLAIYKGTLPAAQGGVSRPRGLGVEPILHAMTVLCEVRTEAFNNLEDSLWPEEQITVDGSNVMNHPTH